MLAIFVVLSGQLQTSLVPSLKKVVPLTPSIQDSLNKDWVHMKDTSPASVHGCVKRVLNNYWALGKKKTKKTGLFPALVSHSLNIQGFLVSIVSGVEIMRVLVMKYSLCCVCRHCSWKQATTLNQRVSVMPKEHVENVNPNNMNLRIITQSLYPKALLSKAGCTLYNLQLLLVRL